MKKWFLSLLVLTTFSFSYGQSFGIRAGLNYNRFNGPYELGVNEKYSLSNGFHFGINYAYNFADRFAIKAELVYTQIGTGYDYDGESFYKVPISANAFFYDKGNTKINMKISNAYLTIPLTIQWEVSKKIEVNVGVYAGILLGPRGSGTLRYVSYAQPDSLRFRQSLIHNYNNDLAGGAAQGAIGPAIFTPVGIVELARNAGAYYNYLDIEKVGTLYNSIDFGFTGGISYFINKGFYIGFRYDIGLVDLTNNEVDVLRKNYDEANNNFIFSKDVDTNIGFQVSFGFRF